MSGYQSPSVLPKRATQSNGNGVGGAPRNDDDDDNAVPGPSSQISSHGDENISVLEARSGHTVITNSEGETASVVDDDSHVGGEEEEADGEGDVEAEGSDEATTAANTIVPALPTTELPEEDHGPPPENNNEAANQAPIAQAVVRGLRHRRRRLRHRMQHQQQQQHPEENQVAVAQAQPQAPPAIPHIALNQDDFLADNDDMRIVKIVVDYETLSVSKGSLALMPIGWILLYFPTYVDYPILACICNAICVILVCLALKMLIWKSDLRLRGPFRTFEVRSFQLIAITALTYSMEFSWNVVFMAHKSFLPLHPWVGSTFYAQMEEIRSLPIIGYLWQNHYLAFRLNAQFFLIAFSLLLLVTCPVTLYRMASRNHQIQEILVNQ